MAHVLRRSLIAAIHQTDILTSDAKLSTPRPKQKLGYQGRFELMQRTCALYRDIVDI